MDPPVYALLSAAPAVSALIGGAECPRIFDGGFVPQGAKPPYIVWQIVVGLPLNTLSDRPLMDDVRVQIDCYAADRPKAKAIADAVRTALELSGHEISTNTDAREFSTQLHLISSDYEFWVTR